MRNAYKILVGKPEGKIQLGRCKSGIILKQILKKRDVKIEHDNLILIIICSYVKILDNKNNVVIQVNIMNFK